jgi:hypothetical protein
MSRIWARLDRPPLVRDGRKSWCRMSTKMNLLERNLIS